MTASAILDLKQRLSKLSEADRRMAAAYLLRPKHESSAGRREENRVMKEMDEGKKFASEICPSNSGTRSSAAYEPVLSSQASALIIGTSKARQKKIIALIFQISEHPGQLGDYATHDESGRQIQHLLLGDWQFSFWPDHAVRELRIVAIAEL